MYREDLVRKVKKQLDKAKNAVIWRRRPRPLPRPRPTPPPVPIPPQSSPPEQSKLIPVINIEHVLNDPTTPLFVKQLTEVPPISPQSNFLVRGYKGAGYAKGSIEYQAANSYVTVAETINIVNTQIADSPLPRWPRTKTLNVIPRAGVDLNAFYDGKSLQFFYVNHPSVGAVYAVDSADIVSHECGHAILDCLRPELWSAPYIEVGAFHEAFGDFCALMHALSHDELINYVLGETSNDLSKTNTISKLAEQFGQVLWKMSPIGRSPDYLRDAANPFKYIDPATLKEDVQDNLLGSEVHNFSRVMTGTIYDAFVAIYNYKRSEGISPLDAVRSARDTICMYMVRGVRVAPLNPRFFQSVLKSMLWVDKNNNNSKYYNLLQDVFGKRDLIIPQFSTLAGKKCPNHQHIVKTSAVSTARLNVHIISAQSGVTNPLYNVEVNMHNEGADFYDKNGYHFDSCKCSREECIDEAKIFVDYLNYAKEVGPDKRTSWEVKEGKLIRTRTCCC